MAKKFTVSDGKMMLILQPAGKGWYAVTSPLDPGLNTQARSIEEAFANAHDAQALLNQVRAEMAERQPSEALPSSIASTPDSR